MDFYYVNAHNVPCMLCGFSGDTDDYSDYGLVEYATLQDALESITPIDIPTQAMMHRVVYVNTQCTVNNGEVNDHTDWDLFRVMSNLRN